MPAMQISSPHFLYPTSGWDCTEARDGVGAGDGGWAPGAGPGASCKDWFTEGRGEGKRVAGCLQVPYGLGYVMTEGRDEGEREGARDEGVGRKGLGGRRWGDGGKECGCHVFL